MRTILPGHDRQRGKHAPEAPVSAHKVERSKWYSREYLTSVWAKRPAKFLALLFFIGIVSLLILVFAAGQESNVFGTADFNNSTKAGVNVGSDGKVRLNTASSNVALHRFGLSSGLISDSTGTELDNWLTGIHNTLGDGGLVRAVLKWNSGSAIQWSKWDNFLDRVRAHNLVWLMQVNTKYGGTCSDGSNRYQIPNLTPGGEWDTGIKSIAHRYGPRGTYAAAHPGFAGITEYEIWNEPNTPTGNANCGTTDMDPATAAQILKVGSNAFKTQAATDGWTPHIIGIVSGAIDIPYMQLMYNADNALLSYLDDVSAHVYMHDNLEDPNNKCLLGTDENVRCISHLAELRTWMDSHGGQNKMITMTEGGYSGSQDSSSERAALKASSGKDVFSEAEQALYLRDAILWIRSHPELKMNIFSPYHPDDRGFTLPLTSGISADAYWQTHLGTYRHPSGALKPWGTKYNQIVDCWMRGDTTRCSGI